MAYKLEPIDQSQFEKALEKAKKQMSEIRFSTHVS